MHGGPAHRKLIHRIECGLSNYLWEESGDKDAGLLKCEWMFKHFVLGNTPPILYPDIAVLKKGEIVLIEVGRYNPDKWPGIPVIHVGFSKVITLINGKGTELEEAVLEGIIRALFAVRLRSQPIDNLSDDDVDKLLEKYNFFDKRRFDGVGLPRRYDIMTHSGKKLVIDHITGMMWQQSGWDKNEVLNKAKKYVRDLNKQRFASYKDWRLPTLEEAMSLMEPDKKNGLFIDPIFDRAQLTIWTADKIERDIAWGVNFYRGVCDYRNVNRRCFVRAVRSEQPRLFELLRI